MAANHGPRHISSGRIVWVDALKAIGMFFVVWGHCIQNVNTFHEVNPLTADILMKLIYSFHMPLFFVISGLTFNPRRERPYRDFVVAKAKGLLWPYLTLSLCAFPIWLVERHVGAVQQDSIPRILLGTLYSNSQVVRGIANAGWFITTLFVAECLIGLLMRQNWNKAQMLLCSLTLLVLGVIAGQPGADYVQAPFHAEVAFVCQFYLLIGWLIRQEWQRFAAYTSGMKRWLAVAALTAVATFCAMANTQVVYSSYAYGNMLYAIVSAIGYSLAIILVVQSITRSRLLSFIGRNTVVFLMFQIGILRLVQHYWPVVMERTLTATVCAIALYAALLIPAFVVSRFMPWLIKFPFGQKR